jgi:hypothetical protein
MPYSQQPTAHGKTTMVCSPSRVACRVSRVCLYKMSNSKMFCEVSCLESVTKNSNSTIFLSASETASSTQPFPASLLVVFVLVGFVLVGFVFPGLCLCLCFPAGSFPHHRRDPRCSQRRPPLTLVAHRQHVQVACRSRCRYWHRRGRGPHASH